MTMNQVSTQGGEHFHDTLRRYSWNRPIFEISMLSADAGAQLKSDSPATSAAKLEWLLR